MLPKTQYTYPFRFRIHANGYLSKLIILLLDLLFAMFSFFSALLITTKFNLQETLDLLGTATLLLMVLRSWSFVLFKTYLIIVRYVGEKDYKNIFYAITFSSILFAALLVLFPGLLPPQEILPIVLVDFLILFTLACGFRILLRLLFDRMRMHRRSRINTAIFGAGELGSMLMRVLKHNDSHDYRVAAFFDDSQEVKHKILNGIKIYQPEVSFEAVIRKYDIKVVIIAIGGLSEERRVNFIDQCLDHHIKVLKAPATASWIHNKLELGLLRDIDFEDLLNRPPIQLDNHAINASVNDKCILVTGCAGSIGREIVSQLLKYRPRQIIGVDLAETPLANVALSLKKEVADNTFLPIIGDVRDYESMEYLFDRYRPDYVFHAAAYKHVPIMEEFPDEAIKTNVLGSKNIADLASEHSVDKFVMISTDKVVNPSNVMGASKRIAEIYVQSLHYQAGNTTRFITTRFGNVLGSNGSVIPIFRRQIEQRKPVTVTHPEVRRFFMTIPEACQLVLEAGAMGKGGEIFSFDMGEPVKITDLAYRMIQMAGLIPGQDIKIEFTGLRPGEKLYEELFDKDENNKPTHHPKIKIAAVRPCSDTVLFEATLLQLIHKARSGVRKEEVVMLMKELVPEFVSQNSQFTALDEVGKVATSQDVRRMK